MLKGTALIAALVFWGPAFAASDEDPLVDYIFAARFSFSSCAQKAQLAIARSELRATLDDEDAGADLGPAQNCKKEQGVKVSQKFSAASKVAAKDKKLLAVLKELHDLWFQSMTSVVPSGSERKVAYKKRVYDTTQNLKELGNKVMAVACKQRFDCMERRGEKLEFLDSII